MLSFCERIAFTSLLHCRAVDAPKTLDRSGLRRSSLYVSVLASGGQAGGMPISLVVSSVESDRWLLIPDSCSVPGQRHQRKIQAVHVVLEIENFRKAGAGELVLLPASVGPLSGEQVVDAGADFGRVG